MALLRAETPEALDRAILKMLEREGR
jgi:hypothetical protein